MQEKPYIRTELPVTHVSDPIGVAINISGIPGEKGVGGAGQSELETQLACILRQRVKFDIGYETRCILAKRMGKTEPLGDKEMHEQLAILNEQKDFSIDHMLDRAVVDFINDSLDRKEKRKQDAVVVGTKILPLLVPRFSQELSRVIPIMIGVQISDEDANQRKLAAATIKARQDTSGETKIPSLDDIAHDRYERLLKDRFKYEKAWKKLVYTPETMRESVHYIYDNTRELNPDTEMRVQLLAMLGEIAVTVPSTAPFLLKYIDGYCKRLEMEESARARKDYLLWSKEPKK